MPVFIPCQPPNSGTLGELLIRGNNIYTNKLEEHKNSDRHMTTVVENKSSEEFENKKILNYFQPISRHSTNTINRNSIINSVYRKYSNTKPELRPSIIEINKLKAAQKPLTRTILLIY